MRRAICVSVLSCLTVFGVVSQSFAEGSIAAKYDTQLYGYVHLNLAYDSQTTKIGNYVVYVLPENTNNNDNELSITANQTRMGINLKGPEVGGAKTRGQIEMEFYGGGAENKSTIDLRHALMEITWLESGISLLAGQTWDLIMTQFPNTVNFSINWNAGMIGHRRPQLRISKDLAFSETTKLMLKAAIARNIGRTSALTLRDTGEDAGVPVGQASIRLATPLITAKPAEIGLSGHFGREEIDLAADGTGQSYETWSGRADLNLPVMDSVTLQVSAWKGSDMELYMGGIGQGINLATRQALDTKGGYVALAVGPCNVGTGIDTVDFDQLASGGRQQNTGSFANVMFNLHEAIKMGVEVSYWQTLYKNAPDGDAVRGQVTFTYAF